ncbi:class I SAM-dependent methyltransferase [Planotetraspora sp. A-T 1434]|uniref:class I SAM-dependent methyltransferase n=1 Tax=Planotetraspora sp. A-T 1434 TaxID=2979219 RepID=UPI0021BED2C0|nr:class I SAM-dependent methyltransferase [Planotetraspora sp. A-T 1434]MCT9930865.1 class I SAM-dependent methyltransferase [Planotetraspora sp. A-T 1434]
MTASLKPDPPRDEYWNHNVHYHRVVLDAVPYGCDTALDVGCGDGLLAAKLASRVGHVTGIDRSAEMIRLAERRAEDATFVEGDFLTWDPGRTYDFVSCVTVIHHMDFGAAVTKMAGLLRPGGTLVIIGLPRFATLADHAFAALALPVSLLYRSLKGGKGAPFGMPMMDAEMKYPEIRQAARRLLPGAHVRRLLLLRYSIVWHKLPAPGGDSGAPV